MHRIRTSFRVMALAVCAALAAIGLSGITWVAQKAPPAAAASAGPTVPGYWLAASDGGVYNLNTGNYGQLRGIHLAKPVVGGAATPDGRGYWLVASDGGIFTFGDAGFFGSTGAVRLNKPIVGMASTPDGRGYWLVASDGGIFTFGNAGFFGSTGGVRLDAPVKSMAPTPDGRGYWLSATDGGVFTFGDAPFLGASGQAAGSAPIVAMMETPDGFPFAPGSAGFDISWPQCGGAFPATSRVAIVGVTDGRFTGAENPCYAAEVKWAGANLSSYIVADPLPSPAPAQALTGPFGTCNGAVVCEAENFGFSWATHWITLSRSQGVDPRLWWLDVETTEGWSLSSSAFASNSGVIRGAIRGMQAQGVLAGIYATSLQWGEITGNQVSFPGIPLWVPGATTEANAAVVCGGTVRDHVPFAGGRITLVQYGYVDGGPKPFDPDFACG